jgi:hypothetical protein
VAPDSPCERARGTRSKSRSPSDTFGTPSSSPPRAGYAEGASPNQRLAPGSRSPPEGVSRPASKVVFGVLDAGSCFVSKTFHRVLGETTGQPPTNGNLD